MLENVQIINKNGDGMFTEGIAYIQLTSTGKKYLFYTLNEKVDNDLTKIYIAETGENPESLGPIETNEWEDLRKKMVKINHKEEVSDIAYLNMNKGAFHIGEPKKLAITSVAKQTFKDAQTSHTLSINQSDTPVTTGTTEFFNHNVVEENTAQEVSAAPEPQSIFANPPQPVMSNAPVAMSQEVVQPPETPVVPEQPVIPEVQPVPTPVIEPQVAPVTAVPTAPVVNPAPVVENSVIPQNPLVENNVVITQPIMEEPAVNLDEPVIPTEPVVSTTPESVAPTEDTNSSLDKPIISDEDALRAINIIQEYIDQETN